MHRGYRSRVDGGARAHRCGAGNIDTGMSLLERAAEAAPEDSWVQSALGRALGDRLLDARGDREARSVASTAGVDPNRKLIERDDIDIVDVSSPGNEHLPMALDAAKAGKTVFCEKPLGNTLDEVFVEE